MAVERDAPARRVIEARHEVRERRLAAARRPDERDGLARRDREIDVRASASRSEPG